MAAQPILSRSAQRSLLMGDEMARPPSYRSFSSTPSAVGTTDTSSPSSPVDVYNAATNDDSGWGGGSLTCKHGYSGLGRVFQEQTRPSILSDSGRSDCLREELRRATSVPNKITQLFAKSPRAPLRVNVQNPNAPAEASTSGRSSLTDFELSGPIHHDDGDGDSCMEGSWRPVADERRVLVEDDVPTHPSGSALDTYLDDLIFDPDKRRLPRHSSVRGREMLRPPPHGSNGGRPRSVSVGSALKHCSEVSSSSGPGANAIGTVGSRMRPTRGTGRVEKHGRSMSWGSTKPSSDGGSPLLQPAHAATKGPSSPIHWHRKAAKRATSASLISTPGSTTRVASTNDRGNWMHSSFSSFGRFQNDGYEEFDDSSGAYSTGMLSTFMKQNSRYPRPTEARTVCIEPSRQDQEKVSIVMGHEKGTAATTTTTFHQVGSREAMVIESLLQTCTSDSSPNSKKEAVRGWLESAAAVMLSPSQHDAIIDSERISTRSSLMVEVSPPFSAKRDVRTSIGGSRGLFSSANTVAGDQVSSYFQGRSTQGLIEMLSEAKKLEQYAKRGPGSSSQLNATHNDSTMNDSLNPHGTDASTENEVSLQDILTRFHGSLGSGLDHRSLSVAGERPSRGALRAENGHRRVRSASDPKRGGGRHSHALQHVLSPKESDLDDFKVPTSSPGRPTNKRSLMRKMHQVPVLEDSIQESPRKSTSKSPKRKKSEKAPSKRQGGKRSTTPKKVREDDSKCSRKSKKKSSGKKKTDASKEVEEELNKSFIDKFLDHEHEPHDSSSQLLPTPDESPQNKRTIEAYKAGLVSGPIEDSISKLRIEPYFLESSQRMILQDPINRREGMKKMKSVPIPGSPSQRLLEFFLHDEGSDKDKDDGKAKDDGVRKSPIKAPESPKKKTSTPKVSKAKKGTAKKKVATKKGSTNKGSPEAKDKKSANEKLKGGPGQEKSTLQSLPRQLAVKEIETEGGQKFRQTLLLKKSKSLSNLCYEDFDAADRQLLVERLKSLTNFASPPKNDHVKSRPKAPTEEGSVEPSPAVPSKASSRKLRGEGVGGKKSPVPKGSETARVDATLPARTPTGRSKDRACTEVVTPIAADVPSADSGGPVQKRSIEKVDKQHNVKEETKSKAASEQAEDVSQSSPLPGRRTKPRKATSAKEEGTSTEARKKISNVPSTSETQWQSVPRGLGAGLMDSHKTERPRSLRSIRRTPPRRARSASKKDFAAQATGSAPAPLLLESVASHDDDDEKEEEEIYEVVSPTSAKSKRKTSRRHEGKPQSTPNLTGASLEDRFRSSNIIRIVEGSILELPDDSTICSELTSDIDFLSSPVRQKLTGSRSDLSAITEGGTSWTDLSASDSISKDKAAHLDRRWQSQPTGEHADERLDSPKSPRKNFNSWFKKSNPFIKK
jgi:hypothetical protein